MMKRSFIYCCAAAALLLILGGRALAQSVVPTTVTVTVVPNAPSNLTVTPTSPTQVELAWTNNAVGADGVSVERKTGVAGIYAVIATTSPDIATYIDNSASPATTYFYRVDAYVGSTYSEYSDEASVTTQSQNNNGGTNNGNGNTGNTGNSGSGGPRGGGGYIPVTSPAQTSVTLSGSAYPSSKIFILEDGQVALQTIAGPDANFKGSVGGLSVGNYVFSVYSEDSSGNKSAVFTFPVTVTSGATTIVSGVFLSPTISVDKQEVKQGDTLTIFGESTPESTVMIQVHSAQTIFAEATSSASGAYLYELDTAPLAMGSHSTESKTASGNLISQDSVEVGFTVGTQNVAATPNSLCPPSYPKGDLNDDCHVNLIDFSMLAYWWGRSGFPKNYNLDGGNTIDLADFSIMAYYWTG